MPKQPKPKKLGRPKLAEHEAKSSTLLVRFNLADRKLVEQAARASGQKLSDWVRGTLIANANE